jgi:hypothetical protein
MDFSNLFDRLVGAAKRIGGSETLQKSAPISNAIGRERSPPERCVAGIQLHA